MADDANIPPTGDSARYSDMTREILPKSLAGAYAVGYRNALIVAAKIAEDADAEIARLRGALKDIEAIDPGVLIFRFSEPAMRNIISRMSSTARDALNPEAES